MSFNRKVNQLSNKLHSLNINNKLDSLQKGRVSKLSNNEMVSKFSTMIKMPDVSKFGPLPTGIKSDLDMPIPFNIEIWSLSTGPNRDGIILEDALIESIPKWESGDIIPFHNMEDMKNITEYGINDECGVLGRARIEMGKDGKKWAVVPVQITNRNVAYQLYLKHKKKERIETSAEYVWTRSYGSDGRVYQTNIRPKVITILPKSQTGHIKGNKLVIKELV